MKRATKSTAQILFALEAALPFVELSVGDKLCSSAGCPTEIKRILADYCWDYQRWNFIAMPDKVKP